MKEWHKEEGEADEGRQRKRERGAIIGQSTAKKGRMEGDDTRKEGHGEHMPTGGHAPFA